MEQFLGFQDVGHGRILLWKNVPITVSGSVISKTDYYFSYICLKLIKINQKIDEMSQILAWRIQIHDRGIVVGHIICRFILL